MKTKKTIRNLAILFGLMTLTASCGEDLLPGIKGEGAVTELTLALEDFNQIENAISADIVLTQGDFHQVTIRAQENIIHNLSLDVRRDKWKIKHEKWVRKHDPITIYITLPDLAEYQLSGSGDLTTDSYFEGLGDLTIDISGSGDVDFTGEAEEMNILLSGSGNIRLEGLTELLFLRNSGSGDLLAYDLEAYDADVDLSGSGHARVFVKNQLNVDISGSGNVYYKGSPNLQIQISGSGDVIDDN